AITITARPTTAGRFRRNVRQASRHGDGPTPARAPEIKEGAGAGEPSEGSPSIESGAGEPSEGSPSIESGLAAPCTRSMRHASEAGGDPEGSVGAVMPRWSLAAEGG